MSRITIPEIRRIADNAGAEELDALERSLSGDPRTQIPGIISRARKRISNIEAELKRLNSLYEFEQEICKQSGSVLAVGLDEVGRGPLAGPLAIGAVVLPSNPKLNGLNDSKQLSPSIRKRLAYEIEDIALASTVVFIEPSEIDSIGIMSSLRKAFTQAISEIDASIDGVGTVLLDGNPMRLDSREVNIIKGDSKCASIAAASIIAKVNRDELMDAYAMEYPQYGFDSNKGYGTELHREAIRKFGLTPIHRKSYCSEFLQDSLF